MYSVKIHPEFRLVHFRFCGPLSVSLFRRAFLDFVESPQFDPTFLMLTDVRDVSEIDADFVSIFSAVQGMSRVFSLFGEDVLCVLLARKDLHFGMSRMLAQILELYSPIRIWSVRSQDEACESSGLDPAVLDGILAEGMPAG